MSGLSRHGRQGKDPEAPNLAGQGDIYLVKALKDYRSGARKDDMMSLVAPALKDQDIDDLAAYYSAIEVSVGPPPNSDQQGRCRLRSAPAIPQCRTALRRPWDRATA